MGRIKERHLKTVSAVKIAPLETSYGHIMHSKPVQSSRCQVENKYFQTKPSGCYIHVASSIVR